MLDRLEITQRRRPAPHRPAGERRRLVLLGPPSRPHRPRHPARARRRLDRRLGRHAHRPGPGPGLRRLGHRLGRHERSPAVTADQASFTVTGSGDITAAGHARQANVSVAGSGDLRLAQLETANATLAVAGSGDIGIRATQTAAVDAARLGRRHRRRPGPLHDQQVRLRRRPLRRLNPQALPLEGEGREECRALEACSGCRTPSPRPLRQLSGPSGGRTCCRNPRRGEGVWSSA